MNRRDEAEERGAPLPITLRCGDCGSLHVGCDRRSLGGTDNMSTSVGLSGTHRSLQAQARKNPFTGQMQMVHTYSILAEEQTAIDAVLVRHKVEQEEDGTLAVLLFNERYPDGFPMHGRRDESLVTFFDRVSISKQSCVIIFDLASSANLAINGDTFSAVTSTEAQKAMGPDYAIVHSAEDLHQLIQTSFED
ncbi:MAG: hypothetical protein KF764_13915 [Labilithrix sp.]|nr:hypothetical protein [Labilithrix sp.]